MYSDLTGVQLDEIIKAISKKPIRKKFIKVERILPPTSVMISNIIEKRKDKEYLELYFANASVSGISTFDKIDILDDGRVIVQLLDHESKPFLYIMCL